MKRADNGFTHRGRVRCWWRYTWVRERLRGSTRGIITSLNLVVGQVVFGLQRKHEFRTVFLKWKDNLFDMVFVKLELGVSCLHVEAYALEVVEVNNHVLSSKTPPGRHTVPHKDTDRKSWCGFGLLVNRRCWDKPDFATQWHLEEIGFGSESFLPRARSIGTDSGILESSVYSGCVRPQTQWKSSLKKLCAHTSELIAYSVFDDAIVLGDPRLR